MIELEKIVKSYGPIKALNGLTLSVPKGSLFGLLGPNGAGKTTSLKILSTLLAPDSGKVNVAGVDALRDPRSVRRRIGYVAQEVAIDKILTGRELLQLQGGLYHLPIGEREKQISELIIFLDIGALPSPVCKTIPVPFITL